MVVTAPCASGQPVCVFSTHSFVSSASVKLGKACEVRIFAQSTQLPITVLNPEEVQS